MTTAEIEAAILNLRDDWPARALLSILDALAAAEQLSAQPVPGSATSPADMRAYGRTQLARLRQTVAAALGGGDRAVQAVIAALAAALEEPA